MNPLEVRKAFYPAAGLCLLVSLVTLLCKQQLQRWNVDVLVLSCGNLLVFLLTFFSYYATVKTLSNPNPNAFVRGVFSGVMLKLFVCMVAAFIYISIMQKDLNKIGLFTVMGLYLVYTFLEVSALTRLLRKNKNG